MTRTCSCPHGFPVCACVLGLRGAALLERSRLLSALAGWPGRVDEAEAQRVLAAALASGRKVVLEDEWPIWLALPRVGVAPAAEGGAGGCGCGGGRA